MTLVQNILNQINSDLRQKEKELGLEPMTLHVKKDSLKTKKSEDKNNSQVILTYYLEYLMKEERIINFPSEITLT